MFREIDVWSFFLGKELETKDSLEDFSSRLRAKVPAHPVCNQGPSSLANLDRIESLTRNAYDSFRRWKLRIWTLTERTAKSLAEAVGVFASPGNGNSSVDVDGNTLCKSAFPAGFHSYAPTFYANSRWTSANRSSRESKGDEGGRTRAAATLSSLSKSRTRPRSLYASAVEKLREPTCNCNLPAITRRHCTLASDRYVADSLDESNEVISIRNKRVRERERDTFRWRNYTV